MTDTETQETEIIPTTVSGPMIDQLAHHPAQAMAMLKARTDALETLRIWAVEQTLPEHWVMQGEQAVPDSAACVVIRKAFGISVTPSGMPTLEYDEDGSVTAMCIGTAVCGFTGATDVCLGERTSTEEFGGRVPGDRNERKAGTRKLTAVERSDLRKAALTNLKNTAARELSGIKRYPVKVLAEKLGLSEDDVQKRVRKGHGHGSSADRGAAAVAEEGVADSANELGREIMRVTGGNAETAAAVLVDITRSLDKKTFKPDGKFKGFDSVRRFTKSWQVKAAWARLKEHDLWIEQTGGEEG